MSIWCAGSSERVYSAAKTAPCPKCGKVVELTRQGHIMPHVESKIATSPARLPDSGTAKASTTPKRSDRAG